MAHYKACALVGYTVCGMFNWATVQSILLYGSETGIVTPVDLAMMEGFHVHAAHRMAGMMPRKRGND